MRHEIEYIHPGRDALKWAIGCVTTSYVRRVSALNLIQSALARGLLTLYIASWASNQAFAARFLYLKTTQWAGLGLTESKYQSFLSGYSILPAWSIGIDAAAGLAYAVAAYSLLRKKISTLWILATGTALNAIACTSQITTVFLNHRSMFSPEGLRHTCLAYAIRMIVIFLLWHAFTCERRRCGES